MQKRVRAVLVLTALLLAAAVVTTWACPDPPWVWIVTPPTNDTVSGTTLIQVGINEEVDVTGVDLYLDDQLLTSLISAPYSYQWDTTKVAEGSHKLRAVAHPKKGKDGKSRRVYVTVKNRS